MGVGGRGGRVGWIFGGRVELRLGLDGGIGLVRLVVIGLGGGLDWDGSLWCWYGLIMAGWV